MHLTNKQFKEGAIIGSASAKLVILHIDRKRRTWKTFNMKLKDLIKFEGFPNFPGNGWRFYGYIKNIKLFKLLYIKE